MMGVAEKRNRRGGVQQSFQRLRGSEYVFVLILKCAVNQHDPVGGQRPARQIGQPFQVLGFSCSLVQSTAAFAIGLKSSAVITPEMALS